MKKLILVLFVLPFLPQMSQSQDVHGGDITWTCNTAGKYVFKLTTFIRCDNTSSPSSSETLNVSGASVSSITCNFASQSLISAECYDPDQDIACDSIGSGAISQLTFISSPVTFSGIPPASGWEITWASNNDPSTVNINGTPGYTLRSVIYQSPGQSNGACMDNSVQFHDSPISKYCTGYTSLINHMAYDPDFDKVEHSFTAPLSSSGTGIQWNLGYSVSSPFPGTYHNSNNIPASILDYNGEIGFLVQGNTTTGKTRYAILHKSYRGNTLVSEVSRDFILDHVSCPPSSTIPPLSNTPPQISFKRKASDPVTVPYPIKDSIWEGDSVILNYTSTDIQFLPGFVGQTNYTQPLSNQFGAGFGDLNNGCAHAPCAILDTSNVFFNAMNQRFEGQYGTEINFKWHTDTTHGLKGGRQYNFHFYTQDNWCPVPGLSIHTYTVFVHSNDTLSTGPGPGPGTGITNDAKKIEKLVIYPNPSSGTFMLESAITVGDYRFGLFSITGNEVPTELIGSSSQRIEVKTEAPPGIYFIRIDSMGETITKKIIIQ